MHIAVVCIGRERDIFDLRHQLQAITQHTITVQGTSSSPSDMLDLIKDSVADLVILDPAVDDGSLLERWAEEFGTTPVLICRSAIGHYAVPAFHAGAAHYLSPTSPLEELTIAINRAVSRLIRYDRTGGNGRQARETRAPFNSRVIALPGSDGIEVRNTEQLLSAHGESGYTRVYLEDESPLLLSRPLGQVEPALREAGMLRVHRSHMINPERVRRVRRGKCAIVELANGVAVDVSERYREDLFSMLQIRIGRRQDLA